VSTGAGFHQSYLFAGPWGSGKTTVGRILARSLLCEAPVDGQACDACISCKSILIGGTSENFVEVDAATNSGKDSIRKITEEITYASFSGKQRIHLFDESHRLSQDALDALLKPMEEGIPGSQNKSLVCIFCTTEPERMKATILSRCAPAFLIKPVKPIQIALRLEAVCKEEGLSYEKEALELIGELTECHIRDALKAVEGVSKLGAITRENAAQYLHLDVHLMVMDILSSIYSDLPSALQKVSELLGSTNPTTLYERLSDASMLAYRAGLGLALIPSYMDRGKVQEIGRKEGSRLLAYASRFSSRPLRPSASMLLCDIAQLHEDAVAPPRFYSSAPAPTPSPIQAESGTVKTDGGEPKLVDDVYVHPRAVRSPGEVVPTPVASSSSIKPLEFFRLVRGRFDELETEKKNGRSGQDNLGSAGADQGG